MVPKRNGLNGTHNILISSIYRRTKMSHMKLGRWLSSNSIKNFVAKRKSLMPATTPTNVLLQDQRLRSGLDWRLPNLRADSTVIDPVTQLAAVEITTDFLALRIPILLPHLPFQRAARVTPSLRAASFAPRGVTPSHSIPTTPPWQSRVTVNQHGQNTLMVPSVVLITAKSASNGILEETVQDAATLKTNTPTSAPSVGRHTMPSPGTAVLALPSNEDFLSFSRPPRLVYSEFSSFIFP